MSASLRWNGLEEFRRALRTLPDELAHEGTAIVLGHAEDAERNVQQHYPEGRTGNLKAGVTLERQSSRFGTFARVRSRAKHASIFEQGTTQRRTRRGWNRGQMPQASEAQRMIPTVVRIRKRMVAALVELVKRAGFEVSL